MATEPIPDYLGRALAKIERDGTLIMAIRDTTSAQIRRLCDVPEDGSPNPPGFSPRKIRDHLVQLIPQIRRRKRLERLRAVAETAVRRETGETDTTVTLDDDGRLRLTDREVF